MVIAIDIRPLLEVEQTGVSVYTKALIDELVKATDHRFILFYTSWSRELPDVWGRPHVSLRRFHWPNKLFNATQALFEEPYFDDLIPEADYFLFPNINFLSMRTKPYGLVVHDISFERYPKFFNWKGRLWHRGINIQARVRAAHDIFAVSKYTADDLIEFYSLSKEKVKVAYPGLASVVPVDKAKPDHPYFLFLGRIEERKNVLSIVQAFIKMKEQKMCSDYHLILAGPMDRGSVYGRRILQVMAERSDIEIVGFAGEKEKIGLLSAAAALVYPSHYEGFGFPPLEAQALGVPVVASNVSSLPEIIGSSGLLIDPDRIDEFTWAMNEIVANETTRAMFIARGRENVKRFNWNATASGILKTIESIS